MIERVTTRSGHTIFRCDGKLTASQVHPVREAAAWVERQALKSGTKRIFVLGLGSGYQIVELKRRLPTAEIVIIESSRSLQEAVRELHSIAFVGVEILQATKLADVASAAIVATFFSGPYVVLAFGPGCQSQPPFYNEVENFLNGRTAEGVQVLLKNRRDLQMFLQPKKITALPAAESLFSIKTLNEMADKIGLSDSVFKIRLLNELVK